MFLSGWHPTSGVGGLGAEGEGEGCPGAWAGQEQRGGHAGARTVGVCQGSGTERELRGEGLALCPTWHWPGLPRVVFLWVIGEKFASRICPEPKVKAGRGPACVENVLSNAFL